MVLKAYYPLDETSGSTVYDVRNGYDASLNGGVSQGANGMLGSSSYSFDGSDGYCSTSFPSNISFNGLTVNAWIYPHANGSHTVATKINPSTSDDGYFIFRTSTDYPDWRVRASGSSNEQGVNFDSNPEVESWSMVTGVYRSETGERELFLNGVSQGVNAGASEKLDIDNSETDIGRDPRNERYFDGRIQDVRIYDHALTEQEILYLYRVGSRGLHVSDKRNL